MLKLLGRAGSSRPSGRRVSVVFSNLPQHPLTDLAERLEIMQKNLRQRAAKAASPARWPSITTVGTAAAKLAAHIREHLTIKGEPTPPSGGPDGGPGDYPATGLLMTWSALRLALFAWEEQHPKPSATVLAGMKAIEEAGALNKIRRGFDKVSRCYGLDRLAAGEAVDEDLPDIDPAAVQCLEWGANKLLVDRPPPAADVKQPKADQNGTSNDPMQSGSAKLSPRELASKHGVDAGALRKRLDRWRYEHDAGYVEVSNPAPREPKYLYDE